ncbi:cellobiose phosphorylase [Methylocapsa palsarum]|uniref:Cellobiose phosphorylase n=1 Tax=Methylocapsa palsarum TaxID=1612308 RepID=A0A1I3VSK7_9HYPH|nr:cellobiose phosphorylase [Methylocapsa palsarum]SFJ98172.1 Cellobiose phosphorylase [Methylocapsa palsarum]
MRSPDIRTWTTPRDCDLKLREIKNHAGLSIRVLPNGCVFSIEHRQSAAPILVNQLLGAAVGGGAGALFLRVRGERPLLIRALGPQPSIRFAAFPDRFVWEGETGGVRHRAILWLHPTEPAWVWRLEAEHDADGALMADALFVQDLGLGERGFLMNNEAYASQYIDHHIERHGLYGPVVMSRQNLAQDGKNPWAVHGCLDGAAAFATDGKQVFGPAFRDCAEPPFGSGADLPGIRLQHEMACAAVQSPHVALVRGTKAVWRFFALFVSDHPAASGPEDLARIDACSWPDVRVPAAMGRGDLASPDVSLVQAAAAVPARDLDDTDLLRLFPDRLREERIDGRLLSFFMPDPPHNRHVVLKAKELLITRRHGALMRSGQAMLPDEETLCATGWMHGVFSAQLTIGNTSFHKLFSVSREPYNVIRSSGLRMLVDAGEGWRWLTVPSAFDMGLGHCRWIYRFDARIISIRAIASGADSAMQWRVAVDGEPCRFLVFGHLAAGERELDHKGRIEADAAARRSALRPDPDSLWGQRFPQAVYHLVTSTPDAIDAWGGDELLYADGRPRAGDYLAFRTLPTRELCFAVTGSMDDPARAELLADRYARGVRDEDMQAPAAAYWRRVTRSLRIEDGGDRGEALDVFFPWLAHDAMIHLTCPHGLEQYTGAAWGTRDVCQGPVEFLLALEHDAPVKEILRIVFAQQYETKGDWPQWFMLEPYSAIQDRSSHGDVIVWPLKALNDYLEATNDLGFLDEPVAWRREDTLEKTARTDSVAAHVEKLLAVVCARFIPGTSLIRYGEGDWNDSLQPVDPRMRDWMVSSWTVALLFQQLWRYAEALLRADRPAASAKARDLAARIEADFNRLLIRDGAVAGYGVFAPGGGEPELLIHPSDARTGLKYSLLPMTRGIIGGLFTPDQAAHHLALIRAHLLFPDGVRLIDRPVVYRGGPQTIFKRAESASFFGREIGLMYVHAHLRYAEAMAGLGEAGPLWDALQVANPIAVTDLLPQGGLRQRNAYFSSSDAAFADRYAASAEWARVAAGQIEVEGGWRVYSSGPGLYANVLIRLLFGQRRKWGERIAQPLLPSGRVEARLRWDDVQA